MKTYEAMFLVDAEKPDLETAAAPVREALERVQAEVLSLKPWDERRLAYEIKGRRRALYLLIYFRAEPERLAALQHEAQLDERILRVMVLSADHLSAEQIGAETPATLATARRAATERQRAERAAAQKAAEAAAAPAPAASGEEGKGQPQSRQKAPPGQGTQEQTAPGRSPEAP